MGNDQKQGEQATGQRFLIGCTDGSMRKVRSETPPASGAPLVAAERAAVLDLIEAGLLLVDAALAEGEALRREEGWQTLAPEHQALHGRAMAAHEARRATLQGARAKLAGPEVDGVVFVAGPGEKL